MSRSGRNLAGAMGIVDEDITRVRDATDIVVLVSEFVALKPGSKVYPGVTAYRLHGQPECGEG